MSGRKKKRVQPQHTFQDLVAQATLAKFGPYISQKVSEVGARIAQQQQDTLETLYCRILAIEEILLEQVEGLTKEQLASRVAIIQDRSLGLEQVEDGIVLGDRVRLEVRTKTKDQPEYAGTSRVLVDNAGTGATLGKDIETAMIGMKIGEKKEVTIGEAVAELTINRVSRRPKKEETKTEATAGAEAKTENADGSQQAENAG